jgi:ribosome-associated toxin RatA of RatAB toxin-antitoxin module
LAPSWRRDGLMLSSISIDVGAPARLVFELARDVERWPILLPHYVAVRPIERHADGSVTARMVALRMAPGVLAPGFPVAWRARVWSDPERLQLRFRHRGGATNGMDVTWRIEPTPSGCEVTIEHRFEPRVPGWAQILDRLFVRPIAGRTLATFKSIAEATASAAVVEGSTEQSATKGGA